jgi:hypothetical protein
MSALLGIIAVIYGGSLVVVAGGGLLFAISARFRREVRDDKQPF